MSMRPKFSAQFKAEAVQLVLDTGRPVVEIARELQIHEGTLGNWVNAWRRENPEPRTPDMVAVGRWGFGVFERVSGGVVVALTPLA